MDNDPANHFDPGGLDESDPGDYEDSDGDPDNTGECDAFAGDPGCGSPTSDAQPVFTYSGPLITWGLDVGYTPKVGSGILGTASFNHLYIWFHPTGDINPTDGVVFDGGPSGNCATLNCGNDVAWFSQFGQYQALLNKNRVDFFSTQLGPSVVYTELNSVGISVPITTIPAPPYGNIGSLNSAPVIAPQYFTGWGIDLLP